MMSVYCTGTVGPLRTVAFNDIRQTKFAEHKFWNTATVPGRSYSALGPMHYTLEHYIRTYGPVIAMCYWKHMKPTYINCVRQLRVGKLSCIYLTFQQVVGSVHNAIEKKFN
jgi:hypothetical protein